MKRYLLARSIRMVFVFIAAGTHLLACRSAFSSATLGAVALSTVVKADGEPLNPMDTIPAGAPSLHCSVQVQNAPQGTVVRVIFVSIDAIDTPDYIIDDIKVVTSGTRWVDFCLDRDERLWPSGRYRAEIYLDGQLARTVAFRIAGSGSTPTPRPTSTQTLAPTPTCTPTATRRPTTTLALFIVEAVTARGIDDHFEAVDPTTTFAPDDDAFYYVVRVAGVPEGTTLQVVWIAVDIGGVPNWAIKRTEYEVTGDHTAAFTLARGTEPWPGGRYRAELYIDGQLARVSEFVVISDDSAPL